MLKKKCLLIFLLSIGVFELTPVFADFHGPITKSIGICSDVIPPKHASDNGQIKMLMSFCPRIEDISMGVDSNHKLYSGQWFNKEKPSLDFYSQTSEGLNISLGGSVATINTKSKRGSLPLIPGKNGFYIEFLARIDDDSNDHFPALWTNAVEHNASEDDRAYSDRRIEQHWMELDVDEGGFQDGMLGTVHEWSGNFPNYKNVQSTNPSPKSLSRTSFHFFSAYYDPVRSRVKFWIDDELSNEVNAPAVGAELNYNVIMSAQSHGRNEPYNLIVKRVRVFVSG